MFGKSFKAIHVFFNKVDKNVLKDLVCLYKFPKSKHKQLRLYLD